MKYITTVFLFLILLLSFGCSDFTKKTKGQVKLTIDKQRSFLQELVISENGKDTILFIDHDFITDIVEIKVSEKLNADVSIIRHPQQSGKAYHIVLETAKSAGSHKYIFDSLQRTGIVTTRPHELAHDGIRLDRGVMLVQNSNSLLFIAHASSEGLQERLPLFLSKTKLPGGVYMLSSVIADGKKIAIMENRFRM